MTTCSSFVVVTLLLAVPTLVSLTQHRGPRQFGTDHIAGILGCWFIVVIFGELIRLSLDKMAYLTKPSRALTSCPELSLTRGATTATIAANAILH